MRLFAPVSLSAFAAFDVSCCRARLNASNIAFPSTPSNERSPSAVAARYAATAPIRAVATVDATLYIACQMGSHCVQGQRIIVTVGTGTGAEPASGSTDPADQYDFLDGWHSSNAQDYNPC